MNSVSDKDTRRKLLSAVRQGYRDKINARIDWANDDTDELPYPSSQEEEYIVDAILALFTVTPK